MTFSESKLDHHELREQQLKTIIVRLLKEIKELRDGLLATVMEKKLIEKKMFEFDSDSGFDDY